MGQARTAEEEGDSAGGAWPPGPVQAGPLRGLRVLDLSRVLAGPYATMLLADLGADVVKIEHPTGDETRRWGPPFVDSTAVYYYAANRNKRSVVLDLADETDRAVAVTLAAEADIVVENFRPGGAERFGLAYEDVRAVNPRCVYCSVSSFGRGNPFEHRRGYDLLMQAMGGMMSITGELDGGPVKVGVAISDLAAGLFSSIGILAAVAARERTGMGEHVEVGLLDSQVALLANQAMNWLLAGLNPSRLGSDHQNVAPYGAFETATTPVVVGAASDEQFRRLCHAIGQDQLPADERFATNGARVAHRAELREILEHALGRRPADEWLGILDEAGVVCGPIRSVAEVLSDPLVQERMVGSIDDPELGTIQQVLSPIRIGGGTVTVTQPPPALGAHTDEVRRHVEHFGVGTRRA